MIKINKDKYYVYIHKDENKVPIYVGKGSGERYINRENRSENWKVNLPQEYYIDIVKSGLEEQDALDLEDLLIGAIGRKDLGKGPLLNQDGGSNDEFEHFEDEIRSIRQAIEEFVNTLTPFPYNKLAEALNWDGSRLIKILTECNMKGEVAKANEHIDKELIRDAISEGYFENEAISSFTGIALNDRFINRINEVKQENGS